MNDGTRIVRLQGTHVQVNAALLSVKYTVPTTDFNRLNNATVSNPTGGVFITVLANDLGNVSGDGLIGSGGAKTGAATITVTVNPVNDAPVVMIGTPTFTFDEGAQQAASSGDEVESPLNGAILAPALSLTVDSATGFPAAPFDIRIEDEQLYVTSVSVLTNTLTVVRGVNGTSAVAHADEAVVNVLATNLLPGVTVQDVDEQELFSTTLVDPLLTHHRSRDVKPADALVSFPAVPVLHSDRRTEDLKVTGMSTASPTDTFNCHASSQRTPQHRTRQERVGVQSQQPGRC